MRNVVRDDSSGVKSPFISACFCYSPRPDEGCFFLKKSMFLEFIIIINRRAGPVQTNPQLLEASFQQQTPDTRS